MDRKKRDATGGFSNRATSSQPSQFHSVWEPASDNNHLNRDLPLRPSQSLDESIGLALNKTFGGNSVNSTFYHWD